MTDIKKVQPGTELQVKIDRMGGSGDYIAFPVKADTDTSGDGIHISDDSVCAGTVAKVEIRSKDMGYPLADVTELISSRSGDGNPPNSIEDTPSPSETSRDRGAEFDIIEHLGLDNEIITYPQESQNRRATKLEDRGKEIRSGVNARWRS